MASRRGFRLRQLPPLCSLPQDGCCAKVAAGLACVSAGVVPKSLWYRIALALQYNKERVLRMGNVH